MAVLNRRRHVRYTLDPMYTDVAVETLDRVPRVAAGHAYDISEGGMRFELDRLLPLGTPVRVRLTLPAGAEAEPVAVEATASLVWLEDADDPPPFRVAATFTAFSSQAVRDRLIRTFGSGRYRLAA